ncbi:cystathionine gamma-synthase [Dentipellis sp. KUC8613]|nr:cystathionine gamma-synthase [Dentipellis sp. KUC8613]
MAPKDEKPSPLSGTDLVHADDEFHGPEVVPSISVTTTFRQPRVPDIDIRDIPPDAFRTPKSHIYSRFTQNVSTRVERVLSAVNGGYALTYSSGLASAFAAITLLQPKRIAITGGYHGVHLVIEIYKKGRDLEVIGIDDEYKPGDICWLETPLNPTGEARDIQYYADKIHAVGGRLVIDSTFAPPPLQYPLKWGADIVMHSGTKYFGGHSDLLCGVLVTKSIEEWNDLFMQRVGQGNMMGSFEAWLLLRSLRTLHLRVPRQSQTATALAAWLNKLSVIPKGQTWDGVPGGIVEKVYHSSLQGKNARGFSPEQQLEGGHSPTFALTLTEEKYAAALPHELKFFIPATSLGGVESLIEQRSRSDPGADPRLIRISVGVEELSDLKDDLRAAFKLLAKGGAKL